MTQIPCRFLESLLRMSDIWMALFKVNWSLSFHNKRTCTNFTEMSKSNSTRIDLSVD